MKTLFILGTAACLCLPAAAFSRGGMSGGLGGGLGHGGLEGTGSHSLSITRSATATGPDSPGTNSLGTAQSGSGTSVAVKGPLLGTGNPAVDKEDAKVAKIVHSICRGC